MLEYWRLFQKLQEVTDEQEEYAQPFVDALNHLRNSEKAHAQPHLPPPPQPQPQQQQPSNISEYTTAGTTGAIMVNPAITTTSATTSTILSKVGMSGGSVTYTNLGKNPTHAIVKQVKLNWKLIDSITQKKKHSLIYDVDDRNEFQIPV